jgi:hypothetical protein
MDDRIARLHQQIFNRNQVPWPPAPGIGYVPDPIKFYRLSEKDQFDHISNTMEYIVHHPEILEWFRNTVIPPGFKNIWDLMG